MKKFVSCVLGVAFAGTVHGHHSMTWHFDRDIEITVEGVISEFKFVNPHGRILIDVTDEEGRIETWDCELNGAASSVRRGWTDEVFQPGQRITITAFPARRIERECYFQLGVFADGRRIARNERITEASTAVASAPANRLGPIRGEIPNFSGLWGAPGAGGGPPAPGDENPYAWLLSEAGLRALEAYDPITGDPSLQCKPVSIRRLWTTGGPTEIRQEDDRVIIRHEFMDAERTVYLDQSEHPEDLTERALGHSIGWFEGRTLVIDTVGYEPGVIYQFPGLPHSNRLHTMERLSLADDGQSFEITWVAEDSEYFVDQLSDTHIWKASDVAPSEYNCVHPELGVAREAG